MTSTSRLNTMVADYFLETSGYNTVEVPEVGFYMWRKFDEECHIGHFYILPEKRKGQIAPTIGADMEKVARENGCTYLSCIVDFENRTNDVASRLIKVYLNFGFVIHSMYNNTQVIFKKELN